MRKLITNIFATFLLLLCIQFAAHAECIYDQVIEAEEFPIGVKLTWATNFEVSNSKFIVERADNGLEFTEIGEVDGAGNSDDLLDYNFLDVNVNKSKVLYRLKQMDVDGSFSYTDILSVNKELANNFMVARMSSIQTKEEFEVTLNAFEEGFLEYKINDWKGNTIAEDRMVVISGNNSLMVDMSDKEPGIYKVIMTMEDEKETLVINRLEDEHRKNVASKGNGNRN